MTDPSRLRLCVDATAIDIGACAGLLNAWAGRWLPVGVSRPASSS